MKRIQKIYAEEDTVLEIEDLKLSGYRLIDVALLTQILRRANPNFT